MALPLRRTNRPPGFIASAASYQRGSTTSAYALRKAMSWQQLALSYIDEVPELSYSSRFYSRMLRPLRIFPAILESDNQMTPITDGLPVDLLNKLKGRDGTMKQILGNYGRLMFSTGEGNLLGLHLDTDDEYWMFVWNDELIVDTNSDGTIRSIRHIPMWGAEGEVYGPEEAMVYRMWTPHPRRSGEADSPMRSVLKIAKELITLTDAVNSTAVSRTVAGMLLMPSELAPPPAEAIGDEDPENDPFIDEMLHHFESQIEDAGSPAASAPWVLWGAYELLDRIRRLDLHDPQNDYMEQSLRKEAVDRMARGLDYPAEVLTGLSSANHWAAKQILDDMWRSHGIGIAEQFVGDLNDAYLRPMLRRERYPDWQHVVVGYDPSQVVVPSDQSSDADAAADRIMISDKGYRALKNIPEKFAPNEDEVNRGLAIKLRDPSFIGGQAPGIAGRPQDPATRPTDPSDGPPSPGPEGDSGRKTRVVASIELGAAEMALARCRELAGIRVKQKEKADGKGKTPASYLEVFAQINGCPHRDIAAKLGPENIQILGLNPATLVKGGADTLRSLLTEWGYTITQSGAIAEMVESYAARTLFKPGHPTLPNGFAAQFERAKEASDVND